MPLSDGTAHPPREWLVQLRWATLPRPLGLLAVHHWFVLFDPDLEVWQRWEVWQDRDRGGTSWGHVHRDLMRPDRPVGGGPCVLAAQWSGAEARRLADVLARPEAYPHRSRYRAWPGPNSNTYAAWVLREAGVAFDLGRRAIGQGYGRLAELLVRRTHRSPG